MICSVKQVTKLSLDSIVVHHRLLLIHVIKECVSHRYIHHFVSTAEAFECSRLARLSVRINRDVHVAILVLECGRHRLLTIFLSIRFSLSRFLRGTTSNVSTSVHKPGQSRSLIVAIHNFLDSFELLFLCIL